MDAQELIATEERKVHTYAALCHARDLLQALLPPAQRVVCRADIDLHARADQLDPAFPELDAALVEVLREIAISMTHLASNATG